MVIEAQAQLPMSGLWGQGFTASSDGQFFPAARQGEAMNLVNARYGSEPGLKAYTHVSDQFGPSHTNHPGHVNESPYILDLTRSQFVIARSAATWRSRRPQKGSSSDEIATLRPQ